MDFFLTIAWNWFNEDSWIGSFNMNKVEFKVFVCVIIAALIIPQFFGCVVKENNKTKEEKIEDINRELARQYLEYQVTDNLNQKYSIVKSIRFKFSDKELDFIKDQELKKFVKECIDVD